jgi:hypothetical protein
MHRRRLLIVSLCCFAVIAAIVCVGSVLRSSVRMDVRLLDSVAQDTSRDTTAEIHWSHRSAIVTDSLQLQFRVAGQWGLPQLSDDYQPRYLSAGTNVQSVAFAVPAGADGCRFSLAYRAAGMSSCRMYGFLNRHGLLQISPNLASKIVHFLARPSAMRHAQSELALPQAEHVKLATAN